MFEIYVGYDFKEAKALICLCEGDKTIVNRPLNILADEYDKEILWSILKAKNMLITQDKNKY